MRNQLLIFFGPCSLALLTLLYFAFYSGSAQKLKSIETAERKEFTVFDKGTTSTKRSLYHFLYLDGLFSKKVKIRTSPDQFLKGDKVVVVLHSEPSGKSFEALEIARNGVMIYSLKDTYAHLIKQRYRLRFVLVSMGVSSILTIVWGYMSWRRLKHQQNATQLT